MRLTPWLALLLLSLWGIGCDDRSSGEAVAFVDLGPTARPVVEAALSATKALRPGQAYANLAEVPPEVAAIVIQPGRARQAAAAWSCDHVVAEASSTLHVQSDEPLDSMVALADRIVAVASDDSAATITLAAAAQAAGLKLAIAHNLEGFAGEGTVALALAGSDELAQLWWRSGLVGSFLSTGGTGGSQLPLPFTTRAILCSRIGATRPAPSSPTIHPLPKVLIDRWVEAPDDASGQQPKRRFGRHGSEPGTFGQPDGIAIDRRGRVIIGDEAQHRIHIYDSDGQWLSSFGGAGHGDGEFGGPVEGVATTADDEILAADPGNGRILAFDSEGRYLRTFGHRGTGAGSLIWPGGIAVGPAGRCYVADRGRNVVAVFSKEGKFLRELGEAGRGVGQLMGPESLTVGPDGLIYVADEGNSRIQVFDAKGQSQRVFGAGEGAGTFVKDVEGLAFDDHGRLWAVDEDAGVIRAFTPQGAYLGHVGAGVGAQPGALASPDGLVFHPSAKLLFVADQLNFRVQAFSPAQLVASAGDAGEASMPSGRVFVLGRVGGTVRQALKYQPLVDHLASQLGTGKQRWTGRVRTCPSLDDCAARLRRGRIDAIVESSLGTLDLVERGVAKPLLVGEKKGSSIYRAVVFVKRGSAYRSLKDLQGQVVGFEDESSTSGFLVPIATLRAAGLTVRALTSRDDRPSDSEVGYRFGGDEETIAGWVFSGKAAAGAFSDLDLSQLGELGSNFRVVHRSEPLVNQLMVVRADLDGEVATRLEQALLASSTHEAGSSALRPTKLSGFFRLDDPAHEGAFRNSRAAFWRVREHVWKRGETP